jgi:predicted nucleic-acid-binding Zn-ribbon protein
MKDGICPKCGSTDIYWRTEGGSPNESPIYNWGIETYRMTYYICSNCRYAESYVPNNVPIEIIEQFWKPVNGDKRKNDQ